MGRFASTALYPGNLVRLGLTFSPVVLEHGIGWRCRKSITCRARHAAGVGQGLFSPVKLAKRAEEKAS